MALLTDRNDSGLTCIANFAGRVWYSGASGRVIDGDSRSPNIGTFVFFTQVIDNKDKYDKCHQQADPTSENISDLVATDGGFVALSGAHRIFKLVPLQNSLVVFADNGVWQILGGDAGFSATGYQVSKVSDVSADSRQSIVAAENVVFFWAKGGIYVLTPSEITPALRPQSLTDTTIQSAFTAIPAAGRRNAIGSYDDVSREIRWLYNDTDTYDGVNNRFVYNKELVYNLVLQAFTINKLSNNLSEDGVNESICSYVVGDNEVSTILAEEVTVGGETVTVSGETVTVEQSVAARRTETATKYLSVFEDTANTSNLVFSFSLYNDGTFKDWGRDDAKGKLITGYDSFGETQRDKRVDSLSFHCMRTETGFITDENQELQLANPSSALITFKYGWTSNDYPTPEDSTQVQGYVLPRQYIPEGISDAFEYPYQMITTKLRPRGSGKAFSMVVETEEGKDLHILGWGVTGSGNGRP